ncbi:MAG TPA: pilus assembly protein PilN [Porticoccaceae bacterium]|nr:pilus assembly protein PilN [Porticoccaceae bacterium]
MANINLLPWREEYRQEKRKEFVVVLAAVAIFSLLILGGWDRWVNGRVDWQKSRNDLLTREIAVLQKQVEEIKELKQKRQQMLERMEVIQSLQANRPEIVKIYDEFVRSTPTGIYFVEMGRTGRDVSLVGYAESNNRVSVLMRQLDASEMFREPNLTKVEADADMGEQGSRFELNVKLGPPAVGDGESEQQEEA